MTDAISSNNSKPEFYGDFTALSALKHDARADNPQALRKAAQQFESLFTEMMLKSMRAANFGDSLTGSDEVDFYQSMFDQQLSLQMAKGRGTGLADMLVQQLARSGLASTSVADAEADADADADASVTVPVLAPTAASQSLREQGLPAPASRVVPLSSTVTPDISQVPTTPNDFVRCLWPHAQSAAKKLGVDPTMLVAQAALETGWGKHVPDNADGSSSLNLFGIKANKSWDGDSVTARTLEYEQGSPIQKAERFKSYASMADCFADYAQLIGGKARYQGVLNAGHDAHQFAQSLQRGGYATDPAYANKLQSVARSVNALMRGAGG
jgi:flagellar protein FlgJ